MLKKIINETITAITSIKTIKGLINYFPHKKFTSINPFMVYMYYEVKKYICHKTYKILVRH